jgi:cytochrome c oxidase subunit II
MPKKWFVLLASLALLVILTACGGNNGNASEQPSESNQTASEELVITAKSWEFDKAEYEIPKDTPVKLTLKNTNGVHGVAIEGTDIKLQGDQSEVVTLAAGTYEFHCNIMCGTGHQNMHAKLIVK